MTRRENVVRLRPLPIEQDAPPPVSAAEGTRLLAMAAAATGCVVAWVAIITVASRLLSWSNGAG